MLDYKISIRRSWPKSTCHKLLLVENVSLSSDLQDQNVTTIGRFSSWLVVVGCPPLSGTFLDDSRAPSRKDGHENNVNHSLNKPKNWELDMDILRRWDTLTAWKWSQNIFIAPLWLAAVLNWEGNAASFFLHKFHSYVVEVSIYCTNNMHNVYNYAQQYNYV